MKQKIEDLVIDDKLQELLHLIKQKSDSFEGLAKKTAAIRAVSLSHNLAIIKDYLSDRTDDTNFLCLTSTSNNIPDDNNSSNLIDNCSTITPIIRSVVFMSSFDLDLAQAIEPEIVQKLQQGVNTSIQQHDSFFRQFSNKHQELLQQYYDANKLLVDCLNSDCQVSEALKEEIEETLLLPIDEIKKRQQQMKVVDIADE